MNKTFRIVAEERDKLKRLRAKDKGDEVQYVDSARNISVVLDSEDLSKDLEEGGFDSGKRDKCAPNSKMFHRLAKYYASKKEPGLAMEALENAQKLLDNDGNFDIMETEALLHLNMGNYIDALKSAEIILRQSKCKDSLVATYVKGQALFNICDFEHALIMFHKGIKLKPNSVTFTDGLRNCEDSIKRVLNSKSCFDNINLFIVGDKMGKFGFYQKRKKIFNRKALVIDKFKNYGAEKDMRRRQLAGVGSKKNIEDPLKEDKAFLKKLSQEFRSNQTR